MTTTNLDDRLSKLRDGLGPTEPASPAVRESLTAEPETPTVHESLNVEQPSDPRHIEITSIDVPFGEVCVLVFQILGALCLGLIVFGAPLVLILGFWLDLM